MSHFVSASCQGEKCTVCGCAASHKLGEEIATDDPNPVRHNLTAYVCCAHFALVIGRAAPCLALDASEAKQPVNAAKSILISVTVRPDFNKSRAMDRIATFAGVLEVREKGVEKARDLARSFYAEVDNSVADRILQDIRRDGAVERAYVIPNGETPSGP